MEFKDWIPQNYNETKDSGNKILPIDFSSDISWEKFIEDFGDLDDDLMSDCLVLALRKSITELSLIISHQIIGFNQGNNRFPDTPIAGLARLTAILGDIMDRKNDNMKNDLFGG